MPPRWGHTADTSWTSPVDSAGSGRSTVSKTHRSLALPEIVGCTLDEGMRCSGCELGDHLRVAADQPAGVVEQTAMLVHLPQPVGPVVARGFGERDSGGDARGEPPFRESGGDQDAVFALGDGADLGRAVE